MKPAALLTVSLCALLLAAGCKGRYATAEPSREEIEAVSEAVDAYFQEARSAESESPDGPPSWLAGAESARVLKVEKMEFAFKALVEFRAGERTWAKYLLVKQQDGGCVVTGAL